MKLYWAHGGVRVVERTEIKNVIHIYPLNKIGGWHAKYYKDRDEIVQIDKPIPISWRKL